MELPIDTVVNSRMYRYITKYNLHHVILWTAYFFFWVYVLRPGKFEHEYYVNSTVFVLLHAIVSYFNIYFLFPVFLQKRYYLKYLVAISLTISLATFFSSGIFSVLGTIPSEYKNDLVSIHYLLTTSMSIVYTTAITMSLKLVKHWYEKERLTKELEKINTETELKFLKAQINPHFLFNSLNSVYSLALQKSDLAPDLILKLSDILRYILYETSEKKVSLTQEIKYLKSYLELEKVRHGSRMELSMEIEGETDSREIAPMLLIPFVENSFKHGLGKDKANGYVKVELLTKGENLYFSIANSKPAKGTEVSQEEDYKGGIGLKNVKKRLNLLYPKKYKLTLNEFEKEYIVKLDINLKE